MKTSDLSKELKVVTDEFVVYPSPNGVPLFIKFTKHSAYVTLGRKGKQVVHRGIQTNCEIKWRMRTGNTSYSLRGATICGPKDNYNEVVGMREALTRAASLSTEIRMRSQIWAAFHAWAKENYEVKK